MVRFLEVADKEGEGNKSATNPNLPVSKWI